MSTAEHSARPDTATSSTFLVGRDSHGCWVAQKRDGKCGGLFVDRDAAVHFALFENGRHPEDIVIVAGVLELGGAAADMTAGRRAA